MAEGGGLLNRYTLSRRIEGSNPSVSAKFAESRRLILSTLELLKPRIAGNPSRKAGCPI